MLFHIQEHHFTIARSQAALDELDLEFVAFDTDPGARSLYWALFGSVMDPASWEALDRLHRRPFLGLYQFWCRARSGA